jgi:hypothetical protein
MACKHNFYWIGAARPKGDSFAGEVYVEGVCPTRWCENCGLLQQWKGYDVRVDFPVKKPKPVNIQVPCFECHGRKESSYYTGEGETGYSFGPCKTCKATGVLPVECPECHKPRVPERELNKIHRLAKALGASRVVVSEKEAKHRCKTKGLNRGKADECQRNRSTITGR